MHEPVEDRIPEGGVADHLVPVLDGELARDEGGAPPGALLDEFQQIAPFAVAKRGEPPVIQDEQAGLGHGLHQLSIGAVCPREHELVAQEARQSHVPHGVPLATRTLAEGTG